MWGDEKSKGEGRERNQLQHTGDSNLQKEKVIKMGTLYREEQPSSLGWRAQSRERGMAARKAL